jgi:hypothetical protein
VAPSILKTSTLQTSGGRSVGIVRSRTQTKEFSFFLDKRKKPTDALHFLVRSGARLVHLHLPSYFAFLSACMKQFDKR